VLNLLNSNANRQNVNILSDFIQNEVWKLMGDEELKLKIFYTMNDRYLESWGILRKEAPPFLYSPNDD
jgi:hypothetical protein